MPPVIPQVPIYLFYGNKAESILHARDSVLNEVVPPEGRDENLTERYPANRATVALAPLMDEIAGDFATVSFISGARKCAVITNPAEIFGAPGGRQKKKDTNHAEQFMLKWIEHELPQTEHVIILIAFEDEAEDRIVDDKRPSALMKAVQKTGYTQAFREGNKAYFRIQDMIAARNPDALLKAVRELWKGGKGSMKVYSSVLGTLRFMLEADIATKRGITNDQAAIARLFPSTPNYNLFKAHTFVQKKYLGPPVYRINALIRAYEELLGVYRALRPRPGDLYVQDPLGLLEQTLMELVQSPRPRR